uniref:ATP synthase F0 subunit 8 n=1 Tax=Lunella correensis TaxID=2683703 RepID=UPI0027D9D404|nr:ATP synthase F0 subunit 8 [Lunella correensis]QUV72919.1 ATP synthase subunit 8 [Lunella correensis]QYF08443.1 ATP synthase F0 subunit 8 [Lunella correensis]
MPQLAPLNWFFLFFLFWFVVGLSSVLIWWSFKVEYKIGVFISDDKKDSVNTGSGKLLKSWDW